MKITFTLIFCSLIILLNITANAQNDTTHVPADSASAKQQLDSLQHNKPLTEEDTAISYRINGVYLKSIWTDLKYTVARPAHWEKRDFIRLGIVVGGAGVLMTAADYEVKQFMLRNHTGGWNAITGQIEPFGNAYSPYLIGGMYLAGVIAKDRKLENAGLMSAKSLLISTLLYTTAKSIIRRGRPTYFDSPFDYNRPFTMNKQHTSFPSGHMNTVTTVATALAEIYGEKHPWVPWVTYSIAIATGATRMYQIRHWSSDVWVGASLGYFVTKSVFRHQREMEHKKALAARAAAM